MGQHPVAQTLEAVEGRHIIHQDDTVFTVTARRDQSGAAFDHEDRQIGGRDPGRDFVFGLVGKPALDQRIIAVMVIKTQLGNRAANKGCDCLCFARPCQPDGSVMHDGHL